MLKLRGSTGLHSYIAAITIIDTKQRHVNLTTDGLWAMLLNSGWVKLQYWQKLKKYVPSNKHGDDCPNGVPALPEKDNANDDSEQPCMTCSVHVCVPTLQL